MRCLLLLLAAASVAAEPFDTSRRVAWTTSKVVGSPEPPLPYRVRPAYPNLKVPCPMKVVREPGRDRLFLVHQDTPWGGRGRIVTFVDRPDVAEADKFLDIDGIAYGLAFHPDYARNGYVYVGMNGPFASKPKFTKVVRYTVAKEAPHGIVPDSEKTIIEWESNGHNGGDVDFGPDGMLYVTAGDGTSDSDTNLTGQNPSVLNAKLLRIDVDRPAAGQAYSIPKDNPFVADQRFRPETYAYGFRNPWRIFIDPLTSDIWVGNNGQDLWEQIYLVERGANYGWSVMEGGHVFYKNRKAGPHPFSKPIVDHHHSEARSMTGGVVYRGHALPDLKGAYIYGDFSSGRVWGLRHEKGTVTWHQELARTTMQVTGFGLDTKGELVICDHGAGLFRLEPNPVEPNAPPFPTKLSETGLFSSVPDHKVAPGLIPYSVNAALWSDGAEKDRYLALPGEAQATFTGSNGWNFPDGTVTVKTFTLETPQGPRRIETRIMNRQQGQWTGYSYVWNDEQTEATLAPAAGVDQSFKVRDSAAEGGQREQLWHVPSRVECMACHSRAANWSLGLSTVQLNRDHDYGHGVVANQLEVLSKLGVVRFDAGKPGDKPKKTLPKAPADYPKLVDPRDPKADLDLRVRSYLHANCAACHVWAGGGNSQFSADFLAAKDKRLLIGFPPHHHTFDLKGAKLVDPGHPERSVLLLRLARRGQNQMPPLASNVVDENAVQMLRQWIEQLPAGTVDPGEAEVASPVANR